MSLEYRSSGVDYIAMASQPPKKPVGRILLPLLLVVLVAAALFYFRDRLSGLADTILGSAETTETTATSATVPEPEAPAKKAMRRVAERPALSVSTPAPVVHAQSPTITAEVISPGGEKRTLHARNAGIQVNLAPQESKTASAPTTAASAVVNAADRTQESTDTAEVVYRPVEPSYPRIAEEMKIQGSVVLQVSIDQAGNIQKVDVVRGPEILARAAEEAVRRWRFRPHYDHGKPVETQARVVVNFTIATQ